MDSGDEAGRIITFYSYKGGTGRTMALANAAWVLASNGYRVLMIDWDLEAPGLHRYFHPFLSDKRLANTKGMIDFVFDYQRSVLALPETSGIRRFPDHWYDGQVDIFPYITELVWQQPGFGELHLLPAGRQGSEYGTRVNTFNWRQLYENLGGYEFFEAIKRQLIREYDYVLVDSRTGVSDTSGISTVQMPDTLVVCFTLNSQSIEGAGEVALSVVGQRAKEYAEDAFQVVPVPTRLEKAEKQKLDLSRDAARAKFDTFLTRLTPADRDRYWGEVEIFYEPFYAYEEVLAAFADKPGSISSLLASIERLTARLTGNKVQKMQSLPADKREEVLALYERRPMVASDPATHAAGIFKRLGAKQEETARNILLRLISAGVGGTAFRTAVATDDFSGLERPLVNRLVDEGLLQRKLAEDGETEYITIADDRLIDTWPTLRGWIQEHNQALRLRESLEQRAQNWDRAGRPSDLLLGTREISPAQSAADEGQLVSTRVLSFIKESARRAVRRKWLVRGAEALAVLVLMGFLIQGYAWPKINAFLILQKARTKVGPVDAEKYIWIKAGGFEMGCSYENVPSYECRSVHVTLTSDFWIGQTEVTNAAYRRYLSARHPDQLAAFDKAPKPFSGSDYPVNNVVWPDAFEYCAWAGGRLPSMAEWEYAARGGIAGKPYTTGDTYVESQISLGFPHRVGSFPPNAFGLFDMSGNVAEWSDDVTSGIPYGSRLNVQDPHFSPSTILTGISPYPGAPRYYSYPGPGVANMAVRGGSYDSGRSDLRLDVIDSQYFNTADPRTGFRCVIPASDLERVASNYQPFSALYGAYSNVYHSRYFDPYRAWWYTIYLRYLENAGRP